MSSHHIVRDEQEPALLVLTAGLLRNESVVSLLEWSPTLLVPVAELDELVSLGYKPDLLLAPVSEINDGLRTAAASFNAVVLEVSPGVDTVTCGLQFFLEHNYKAVNILDSPSPSAFEELSPFLRNLDLVFYSEDGRWLWREKGLYKKWLTEGSAVTVYPPDKGAEFSLSGFETGDTTIYLDKPTPLVVASDGMVTISSSSPFFLKETL